MFVLDRTNPAAQEFLRQTYRTLVREWGAKYIKLDFMDNTAIEGYYFRPHTTALEAQRIGLQVIREAVGDDVLLDKDGSPMLNPVGLVDDGRVSQDTGHTFSRSKEAAPGIAARYYMHRNFFINDPDAFTVSRQLLEEREIQAPLTLRKLRFRSRSRRFREECSRSATTFRPWEPIRSGSPSQESRSAANGETWAGRSSARSFQLSGRGRATQRFPAARRCAAIGPGSLQLDGKTGSHRFSLAGV